MILNRNLPEIITDAQKTVRELGVRTDAQVPDSVSQAALPRIADLKNSKPFFDYKLDGTPVSGVLLPSDFARGQDEPGKALILFALAPVIGILAYIIFALLPKMHGGSDATLIVADMIEAIVAILMAHGLVGRFFDEAGEATWLLLGTVFSLGFYLFAKGKKMSQARGGIIPDATGIVSREIALRFQAMKDSASGLYLDKWKRAKKIREQQMIDAAKDETPILAIGEASGMLLAHGDRFAPDDGTQVSFSTNDLTTGLLIFGRIGTGKTVLIRKLLAQSMVATDAGLFLLDGKGTLAGEMRDAGIPGLRLIKPDEIQLPLFQGMTATEVTDALAVFSDKGDPFFQEAARQLLQNCAVLLYALSAEGHREYRFTAKCLHRLMNDNSGIEIIDGKTKKTNHGEYRKKAIELIAAMTRDGERVIDSANVISQSYSYFQAEFESMTESEKTFAGVMMTANNWLSPLFENDLIAAWADCDEGLDVTTVVEGARLGLDIPENLYGRAAVRIISNLVREKIYVSLKRRGNDWREVEGQKQVIIVMDEMHLLWRESDTDFSSISRSLGGSFIAATQSLDILIDRIGSDDKALATAGNFRSMVCYDATQRTLEYASARAGAILRPTISIHSESDEVTGVALMSDLSVEYNAARDTSDLSGEMQSKLQSKSLLQRATSMFVGDKHEIKEDEILAGAIGNCARAIYSSITQDELQIALQERFAALAVINRAGAPRRDVITVRP